MPARRLIALALVTLAPSVTRADTLAYWRFEDHPAGAKLDAKTGTEEPPFSTAESSAKERGLLRTWNTRRAIAPPDTSGTFVAPPDLPKLVGEMPNERGARFVGNQDFYSVPESPIDSARLPTFTVEALFNLSALSGQNQDRFQTVVGKDGKPIERLPFQPFVAVVGGHDNEHMTRDCLAINIIDRSGTYRSAASRTKLERDRWYAFAAVCDGQSLKLFINRFDGKGYQHEGEAGVDGGLIDSTGTWTIGRGMFDRGPNSWLQGFADEIRISDEALPPEKWLTAGVNEIVAKPQPPTPAIPKPIECVTDLADPAVLLHDGVYYLYGTATDGKGFDVYTSRDLKHWEKGRRVIEAGPGVWGDDHFWAPGVIEHNGRVYLYYSANGLLPDAGQPRTTRINIAVADSPAGPFREVLARMPLIGRAVIDPQPFIDDDGKAYLYFVGDVSEGRGQIYMARLADDLLSIVGEPIRCIESSQPWEGPTWNEGPFVIRDGDTYVLMYSGEFWASPNYAVGFATSPSPLGPWKKYDENPILRRYAGLLGTGHNSVVRSPDGKSWLTFFHAHRGENDATRDTYLAELKIDRDARGEIVLKVGPWADK